MKSTLTKTFFDGPVWSAAAIAAPAQTIIAFDAPGPVIEPAFLNNVHYNLNIPSGDSYEFVRP